MKEKLEVIKAALEKIAATKNMKWAEKEKLPFNCELAEEALTTLQELNELMGSEAQIDAVRIAIQHSDVQVATTGYKTVMSATIAQAAAIAAINTILGN